MVISPLASRLCLLASVFVFICQFSLFSHGATPNKPTEKDSKKILYIMSYHSPWRWTDDQFRGFKDGLAMDNAQYQVFQMNTKNNSSIEAKKAKAEEAKKIIEQWKPDLVYTSDDDAQEYVTKDYINSTIPFVFSGVNKEPAFYGFVGSSNIAGVVEHEHFVESTNLIRAIDPSVKKLAVVFDDAPMWPPIMERVQTGLKRLPEIEVVAWDVITTYADFKKKMQRYQSKADAVALIGIFNFRDEEGNNVPYDQVLRWTTENSHLPDYGFWIDRVHHGTLAAVTVSGHEQGLAAGKIARAILVDGRKPSDIPFKATAKGVPVINLARAKKLGIKIRTSILLSSQVIKDFEWDK